MLTHYFHSSARWLVVLLLVAPWSDAAEPLKGSSALFDYVKQPDPNYQWRIEARREGNPSTTFVVKLTSQAWRTNADVDRAVWEHWLLIVKPSKVTTDRAFLFITGGSNGSSPPAKPDATTSRIAEATGSVVAELRMVPNQPLVFHQDGMPRKEDDLIGYAWNQYVNTGDPSWLPRLPMVKSAVRAMDCIQELMASKEAGELAIEKFVVAGGSKRGWTTWMTGASDPRVEAIVPIVIDVLNVEPSMRHHAGVYGFWAEAIGDYVHHGITRQWGNPRIREIYAIEDPFCHLDRLTMPKYIVNSAGDQFFCPDSSKFYFDELRGEKHLRYVPNSDHSLRNSDAVESVAAFYHLILTGQPRPQIEWTFSEDGSIRATTKSSPTQVKLWRATNPTSRDFRLKTIGPAYASEELKAEADGSYVGRIDTSAPGWTAFFIEMTFSAGAPIPLKLTTAVRVLPDTLPHANADPTKVPYEREAQGTGG